LEDGLETEDLVGVRERTEGVRCWGIEVEQRAKRLEKGQKEEKKMKKKIRSRKTQRSFIM
jgi:hypothetical protein